MKTVLLSALFLVVYLGMCEDAWADTRRVAVVVGNNTGGSEQIPLRYAENDAGKLARVLAELGGVESPDLFLLQGKSRVELTNVLQLVGARVRALQEVVGTRVVLLFYFSGHSDGLSLELGGKKVRFVDVKEWLTLTGADVRILILDSCKSGNAIASKGGRPGPGFDITLRDELDTRGEAILVSSAADELALESSEIRASFFSHHFTIGLRGAADKSGDGLVTLAEAYQYAYSRTVLASDSTLQGRQHPHYDYRLSGQGELILTDLGRKKAGIVLPEGFSRALIVDLLRDQVVAELSASSGRKIALSAGKYALQIWRRGEPSSMALVLRRDEEHKVSWSELKTSKPKLLRGKGALVIKPKIGVSMSSLSNPVVRPDESESRFAMKIGLGATGGVSTTIPTLPTLKLGIVDLQKLAGVYIELAGASSETHSEWQALVAARFEWELRGGSLKSFAAADLGLGFVSQINSQATRSSGIVVVRPLLGVRWASPRRVFVEATGGASMMLVQRDSKVQLDTQPVFGMSLGWKL